VRISFRIRVMCMVMVMVRVKVRGYKNNFKLVRSERRSPSSVPSSSTFFILNLFKITMPSTKIICNIGRVVVLTDPYSLLGGGLVVHF
jgi:hypothetical protein